MGPGCWKASEVPEGSLRRGGSDDITDWEGGAPAAADALSISATELGIDLSNSGFARSISADEASI